jgi:hypothetical protein
MSWVDRRLILVEWKDAACDSSWQSADTSFKPAMCWTIGLVVQDDEEVLAIAGTITEGGDINQVMIIPRGMVTSIEDITKP